MPTPRGASTAAGETGALGRQVAEIVATDLRNSGLFTPGRARRPARRSPIAQVTAPDFAGWAGSGAQALVQGFVQANGDGTLTVGCYLYDVAAQTELDRQGFVVQPARLAPRRAQMRRHDLFAADRRGPLFRQPDRLRLRDRAQGRRVKRLAIMD